MSAATTKLTRVRTSAPTHVTEAYLPVLHDHATRQPSGPDPLPIITRLIASLTASIRPAVPNAVTLAFLDGNARKWGHTTTTILLRDHYSATVAQKYGHRLRQDTLDALRSELSRELDAPDPADALRDGSLPSSDLPPTSPDPGVLNSDDRSPSQASCYSLFSSLFLPTSIGASLKSCGSLFQLFVA
ncbi:unnamed protein product [Boreogadus saida]